jgi:hypothetical protein
MIKPIMTCVFDAVNDFLGWVGLLFAFAAIAVKLSGEQDFPPSRLALIAGLAFLVRMLQLQWKLTKAEEYAVRLRANPQAPPPF